MKSFYVFRHGQTDLNLQERLQGSGMDVPLNETGRQQAETLVRKFKDIPLEVIYTSPLLRARQTAEALHRAYGVPVIESAQLRECFYGDAEGQPISDLKLRYPDVYPYLTTPGVWDIHFPGGESKRETMERVLTELFHIARTAPESVIGVSIHGGTMAALLNHFDYPFETISNVAVISLLYDTDFRVAGRLF